MQAKKCSMCGEPQRRKMASFYWNWTWPSGDRRGYKQFFDAQCCAVWTPVINLADKDDTLCVGCGEPNTDDRETRVWGTIYLPGEDRYDVSLGYHLACFEKNADRYMQGAERLPERLLEEGVGRPTPSSREQWPSWGSMGIQPR